MTSQHANHRAIMSFYIFCIGKCLMSTTESAFFPIRLVGISTPENVRLKSTSAFLVESVKFLMIYKIDKAVNF